jgi:hypothetical protein
MLKRRVIAAVYALALVFAIPARVQAMDCYSGRVVMGTDGVPYCEPFIGDDCLYCEVVDKR